MSKFNRKMPGTPATSPVRSESVAVTAEGGLATAYDAKGQLYLLAVTNMVSEGTFYEKAEDRDKAFTDLVRLVAAEDPSWLTGMFPWLRTSGFMRSAAVQGAADTAKTLCDAGMYDGITEMVDGSLQRPDEVGEFLAYWLSITSDNGKFKQPKRYKAVFDGLRRAVVRMYTERNYLKYDSDKTALTFDKVIQILHPAPKDAVQRELFGYILDRKYKGSAAVIPVGLKVLRANTEWRLRTQGAATTKGALASLANPDTLKDAGLTWEDVLSALGGAADKKLLWEALIPNMGLMALCRNLRNFDQAGVSDTAASKAVAKLNSPEQVRSSKMFPFRFLAAYRNAPSLRWGYPLEQALNASLANVPELPGRTLILVDMSGSMGAQMSGRSDMTRADAASVFGAALALRCQSADLVQYGTSSSALTARKGDSALKVIEQFHGMGGTNSSRAAKLHFARHDRVVILTDGQSHDGDPSEVIPKNVPLYTWDLAGYGIGSEAGVPNRHVFGGLSDASFQAISLLERKRSAKWPWQ